MRAAKMIITDFREQGGSSWLNSMNPNGARIESYESVVVSIESHEFVVVGIESHKFSWLFPLSYESSYMLDLMTRKSSVRISKL